MLQSSANNKEQEVSLLHARRGALAEEIKALEERIALCKEESNALLDAELTESIVAHDINEQVTIENRPCSRKKEIANSTKIKSKLFLQN